MRHGGARSGWTSSGARTGPPPPNPPDDLMKTSIRLIKRDDRKVSQDIAIASASSDRQRMTEVTVNSWIIEFRERRRSELSRLRSAVLRKEIEGVTRG
jgi:hypothetical protein